MRLSHSFVAAAVAAFLATTAHAASDIQAELRVGEPDFTLSVRGPVQPDVSWRLDASRGSRQMTKTFRGKEFDVTWERREYMAALEIAPFSNGLHMVLGVVHDAGRIDAQHQALSGTVVINKHTYQLADVGQLSANMRPASSTVPYVGLGWRSRATESGWSFSAEVGALAQNYTGRVSVTCGAALTASQCAQLQSDAASEQVKLNNSLSSVDWIPSASVGVSYRF